LAYFKKDFDVGAHKLIVLFFLAILLAAIEFECFYLAFVSGVAN